jgi:recombinational DNA repair protein RecT
LLQFQQSGSAKWITANCVYEGDEFQHWIDEHGEHLLHKPGDTFDEKKIVRAYAMASTKDGAVFIRVMPRAEIDKHRSFSRIKRDDSPWLLHYSEMAKKTVLHGLAKTLPNAPVFESDEEFEEDARPQLAAVAPDRERGAAAALDAFASSPEGEIGGSDDVGSESAAQPHEPSAAPADASTALADAKARGADAKKQGHQRKAMPGEYRTPENDALAQSWLEGWDGK